MKIKIPVNSEPLVEQKSTLEFNPGHSYVNSPPRHTMYDVHANSLHAQ